MRVLYDGGTAQASFSNMRTGGYATFDPPYVCLEGDADDADVRLVGIELSPADTGIEVTAVGVAPAEAPGPMSVTAKRRLETLPQAASLTPDNVVTARCDLDEAAEVWMELHKTADGDLATTKTRYVYEVDGQTQTTDWFDQGYALTVS